MMKGSIQEEDITITSIYSPNIGTPKHKANINRSEGRNVQQYNNNEKLQYPIFNNR